MTENKTVKIMLVSESKLLLEGTKMNLECESNIEKVYVVTNYNEIIKNVNEIKPDFIFIDNRIPRFDITKLCKSINHNSPKIKIIILNDHKEDMLDLPNTLCLAKHRSTKDLIKIIKGESIRENPINTIMSQIKQDLTNRELEVMNQMAKARTNKEIASNLSITEKTVKAHLTKIYTKLGIQNRFQLTKYSKQFKKQYEFK